MVQEMEERWCGGKNQVRRNALSYTRILGSLSLLVVWQSVDRFVSTSSSATNVSAVLHRASLEKALTCPHSQPVFAAKSASEVVVSCVLHMSSLEKVLA